MSTDDKTYNDFRLEPPENFRNAFSHFYFAENYSDAPIRKTLLPSYQTILVFNFGIKAILYSDKGTNIKLNKYVLLGPIKKAFDYSLPTESKILVAVFKGDAFFRFFGATPRAESRSINLNKLVEEDCFTTLWSQLDKIKNPEEQLKCILAYCKPYLKEPSPTFEKIVAFDKEGLSAIKTTALLLNQTERAVQINYKKRTGHSAKELTRSQRFLTAIRMIQKWSVQSNKINWFEIIDRCGYYDQSQLIHDFQHYLRLSPTKYLKFQQDICNPV